VGRSKRSTKLLEDMTLARCVFGLLMDWAGFVEVTPAASTILGLGSRFDLDLTFHVAGCYASCITQDKRHAGGRRSHARAFATFADFDCVREHALDTIDPSDQVAWSGWVGFCQ
jgi:hypothetical protein